LRKSVVVNAAHAAVAAGNGVSACFSSPHPPMPYVSHLIPSLGFQGFQSEIQESVVKPWWSAEPRNEGRVSI
jgi:hypothetical protein